MSLNSFTKMITCSGMVTFGNGTTKFAAGTLKGFILNANKRREGFILQVKRQYVDVPSGV